MKLFSQHQPQHHAPKKSSTMGTLTLVTLLLGIALTAVACSQKTAPDAPQKTVPIVVPPATIATPAPEMPAEAATDVTPPEAAVATTAATTASSTSWQLVLVNEKNPLPTDFTIKTQKLANGKAFDSRAIGALEAMIAAAAKEDVVLQVCSSYRTVDYQTGLFNRKVDYYVAQGHSKDEAYAIAKTIVAIPGTSEHNLGLAADIITPSYQTLDSGFDQTPAFAWLHEHAAQYGFILRYPNGKGDITGIIYEPWHYRYVGVDAAKEISARGICLEEYLDHV